MPRRKREERYLGLQCVQCDVIFDAVREDAKTCSARCRVAFNRDKKAAAAKNAAQREQQLRTVTCADCLFVRDSVFFPMCPMCRSWKVKTAS